MLNDLKVSLLSAVAILVVGSVCARAEVLIAVAGPMTGQNVYRGEQVLQGAEMAVADINREGGVLGENVRLIVGDDACFPDQAVAVAHKLVSDGVVFVAGHTCSHSSIPASKVYEQAGVVMISPASTNPKLTDEGGDNVFRVCGRDDQQGIVAGDHLADVWGDKRIAILHDGSTYGKGLADETRKQLNKRGVQEVLYEAYVPGQWDYSPLVSMMQSSGIDVFYLGGYAPEGALILRQAHAMDDQIRLVGGDSLTTDEFWMISGPAGEGTRVTFGPDPRGNAEAAPVVKRFRDVGFEPSGYTLHTYAAIQAWAQAVEMAGSLDPESVIASLRGHNFQTVLGEIGFNDKGDVTAPGYVWYVWKNGEYVLLE